MGTGLTEAERREPLARLEPMQRRPHPFALTPPREDVVRARWVDVAPVAEVVFRQFTRGEKRPVAAHQLARAAGGPRAGRGHRPVSRPPTARDG